MVFAFAQARNVPSSPTPAAGLREDAGGFAAPADVDADFVAFAVCDETFATDFAGCFDDAVAVFVTVRFADAAFAARDGAADSPLFVPPINNSIQRRAIFRKYERGAGDASTLCRKTLYSFSMKFLLSSRRTQSGHQNGTA